MIIVKITIVCILLIFNNHLILDNACQYYIFHIFICQAHDGPLTIMNIDWSKPNPFLKSKSDF